MKLGSDGDRIVWSVTEKREAKKDESLGPEIELNLSGEYVFGEKSEVGRKRKRKKNREKRETKKAKKSAKKAQVEIQVDEVNK